METVNTSKEIADAVEMHISKGGFFNHWTDIPTIVLGKAWPGKTGVGSLRQSTDPDAHVKAYRYYLITLANYLWGLYLSEVGPH